MKPFKKFTIASTHFDYDTYVASCTYHFDDEVFFTETIDLSPCKGKRDELDPDTIDMLLFHLSLSLWISYYKAYPTSDIYVETGSLDAEQCAFWKTFYIQWLGEFFYTNDIEPTSLANIVSATTIKHTKKSYSLDDIWLVPIGGGKDSCVTIEELRKQDKQIVLYTNGRDYSVHQDIADVAWYPRICTKRTIDPQLFELNTQWYYNWHVPITGIISYISLVVTYLCGYKHIAFSNERSANFGNTQWKWLDINHQRSKSHDFEKSLQVYIQKYIHNDLVYTSVLRSWYEVRIAQTFATYEKYFSTFTSCNRNFHLTWDAHQRRCHICPKCLFTYALLRPHLTAEQVDIIWWKELYTDEKNLPLFQELRWVTGIKPFECVGTYDEVQYATWLLLHKYGDMWFPITQWFQQHVSPTKDIAVWKELWKELMVSY